MKILICGAYGRLGAECVVLLAGNHEVVAVDTDELDITDKAAVLTAVREVQPDWILNCAAYTDVDGCESDGEAAWRLNVQGPENLAAAADVFDGRLLHLSADHVFDGGLPLGHAYSEEDLVSPESVYGRTMAAGEEAALQFPGNRNCVVRTSWLYGSSGRNFLKTMLGLTLKNPCQPVQVVADQYGAPTWTATLAGQIKILLETESAGGIYHATAEGYCSWYELGVYFLKQMDLMHALTPGTTVECPTPAPRPKNAILDNSRLKAAGLHCMQNWQDDVDRFVDQHRQALMEECLPARPQNNRIC
ncbi:MAG: dTDP-4-dehydrorhamnose reductase [Desulfosudaceae bacterium]